MHTKTKAPAVFSTTDVATVIAHQMPRAEVAAQGALLARVVLDAETKTYVVELSLPHGALKEELWTRIANIAPARTAEKAGMAEVQAAALFALAKRGYVAVGGCLNAFVVLVEGALVDPREAR